MLHHIICKFVADAPKDRIVKEASELFANLTSIPGIRGVEFKRNCIARDNRFDLMIVIDMDKEALPVYDESIWHKRWKSEYGQYIEKKAIFDCE